MERAVVAHTSPPLLRFYRKKLDGIAKRLRLCYNTPKKGGAGMEKIITYETLRYFAYSNDQLIKGDIKGIVLDFYGLGGVTIQKSDPGDAVEYAAKGIVYIIPYYNPWCWMNRQTVRYVDEIVAVICEKYRLDASVKIVSTGGSMGGLSALVYCAYAKITPCACVTNCPVCDLVYHYTERPDLPRTLYSAFGDYEGTMEDALKSCSPLHLAEKLPHIPYTVFHCEADKSVNLEKHSLRFVEAMEAAQQRIVLRKIPFRGHCDLSAEGRVAYMQAILSSI